MAGRLCVREPLDGEGGINQSSPVVSMRAASMMSKDFAEAWSCFT